MKTTYTTAFISAAILSACATPPTYDPVLPYDAERAPIASLAVLPDALPENATALDTPTDYFAATNQISQNMVNAGTASPGAAAGGGLLAGLILSAVEAGIDANRNSKFRKMLDAQSFDGPDVFQTALESALTDKDLSAQFASGARTDRQPISDAALSKIKDDAALDIRILSYGYKVTPGGWQPSVVVDLVMKDPGTGKTLMTERLTYGAPGTTVLVASPYVTTVSGFLGNPTIIIPYEEGYGFNSVDAFVETEPAKAVEGLRLALVHTADAIAGLVTQPVREQERPLVATDLEDGTPPPAEEMVAEDVAEEADAAAPEAASADLRDVAVESGSEEVEPATDASDDTESIETLSDLAEAASDVATDLADTVEADGDIDPDAMDPDQIVNE